MDIMREASIGGQLMFYCVDIMTDDGQTFLMSGITVCS